MTNRQWHRKARPFNFNLLDDGYRNTLIHRINNKSLIANGCKLWTGATNSSGYPQMRIKDPSSGDWLTFSVHKIVYGLAFGNELGNVLFQVSHLCHKKSCVEITHLNYETVATNCQRFQCRQLNECSGHRNEPNCLL